MYSKYYGFSHKPFELTPDPGVIFLSETHQEAISILRYGVLNHKGFLQLTGNVGSGKSTLLQSLIQSLESNIHLCYIPNPNFTVQEFYYFLGAKFGLDEFDGNKAKFIISFGRFLHKCKENNELVLLIIDEAQVLSLEVLEEIRLISNQELHEVFGILSIFLVGQPELNDLLDHRKLLPLRNRIAVRFNIEPLTLEETTAYIRFRLLKGGRKTVLFPQNAFREIHRATGGIPRTINILCDNSLLAGFVEQRGIIDENIIRECVRELGQAEEVLPKPAEKPEAVKIKENIAKAKHSADEPKKQSAFLRPGRAALTVVALFAIFVAMAATTEYWGRLTGAAPVKVWFETVNVHVDNNILLPLKKLVMPGKYKTESSSQEISPFSENAVVPAGISEEKHNTADSITDKKKTLSEANETSLSEGDAISENPATGETPSSTYYVSIRTQVAWANIRSGPSMQFEVLRVVSTGFPLLILDQQEEWSQVEDFQYRKGWVANKLLAENSSVILKTAKGNLRSGPSLNDSIVKQIDNGAVMQIEGEQGSWLKVINMDGITGWVHKWSVWP